MSFELTVSERELLLVILRERLGALKEEVHHSRTSKFTDELKRTETELKGIIRKLEAIGSES